MAMRLSRYGQLIASFLASRCADLGLEVALYEVGQGRMNVVGTLKGSGGVGHR